MVRNGISLDYCFRECIRSMLVICDEVVVSDGESEDGTQEELREWAAREPKLKLCIYPWPDPKGDIDFFVNWIQYTRQHVSSDYILQLDADEVLDDRSHEALELVKQLDNPKPFSLWADRLNFWRDHKHLIPHGFCCGDRVIRVAPQKAWLASDGPHPGGVEVVMMARPWPKPITIFHYGFLRDPRAYFRKSRALQGFFFDSYDQRLANVEDDPRWMEHIKDVEWTDKLVPYNGHHPEVAKQWLKERGYQ